MKHKVYYLGIQKVAHQVPAGEPYQGTDTISGTGQGTFRVMDYQSPHSTVVRVPRR